MKLSKKQAKRLTQLINAIGVYDRMAAEVKITDTDYVEKKRQAMKWCDENTFTANEEFGLTLHTYQPKEYYV
jgi:hypothetical protein